MSEIVQRAMVTRAIRALRLRILALAIFHLVSPSAVSAGGIAPTVLGDVSKREAFEALHDSDMIREGACRIAQIDPSAFQ